MEGFGHIWRGVGGDSRLGEGGCRAGRGVFERRTDCSMLGGKAGMLGLNANTHLLLGIGHKSSAWLH